MFTRNKEAENEIERNITNMKMTKCRWTGNTSPNAGKYYYDNATHTVHDLEDFLDRNPDKRAEYEMRHEEGGDDDHHQGASYRKEPTY